MRSPFSRSTSGPCPRALRPGACACTPRLRRAERAQPQTGSFEGSPPPHFSKSSRWPETSLARATRSR
ncbi:hypothetical protein AKJ09_02828 [Labilithrix luteola]|uniref:Uncharacterized protein n=1 Tax=Labilithrix luteola TaxID=1391654 RepID=A0A0K1PSR3_9BACT|nr:hypothetical protein AKJ09_02828 [Labilithrix luteola]